MLYEVITASNHFGKLARKLLPLQVALVEVLGHRAAHDLVDHAGDLGAIGRRRRRLDVRDLVDQAEIVP